MLEQHKDDNLILNTIYDCSKVNIYINQIDLYGFADPKFSESESEIKIFLQYTSPSVKHILDKFGLHSFRRITISDSVLGVRDWGVEFTGYYYQITSEVPTVIFTFTKIM